MPECLVAAGKAFGSQPVAVIEALESTVRARLGQKRCDSLAVAVIEPLESTVRARFGQKPCDNRRVAVIEPLEGTVRAVKGLIRSINAKNESGPVRPPIVHMDHCGSRLRRSKTRAACVFGRSDALLGNCDAGRRKRQSFCGIAMPCAGAVRRTVGLDHLEQFSL